MFALHSEIAQRGTIGWQFVRHHCGWSEALCPEQFAHQFQCGRLVSSGLDQEIQDLPFTINGAPQIHIPAIDQDEFVDCAELVQRAVPLLASIATDATTLNDLCLQITRIEERADDIHDRGLKRLYQKAKDGDPMEFVRGNEIYGHLEESVDRFDDVANEIQGIVIEQV